MCRGRNRPSASLLPDCSLEVRSSAASLGWFSVAQEAQEAWGPAAGARLRGRRHHARRWGL